MDMTALSYVWQGWEVEVMAQRLITSLRSGWFGKRQRASGITSPLSGM
jgi:hypothetical protein